MWSIPWSCLWRQSTEEAPVLPPAWIFQITLNSNSQQLQSTAAASLQLQNNSNNTHSPLLASLACMSGTIPHIWAVSDCYCELRTERYNAGKSKFEHIATELLLICSFSTFHTYYIMKCVVFNPPVCLLSIISWDPVTLCPAVIHVCIVQVPLTVSFCVVFDRLPS